jgi:hypothetical protein
VEEPEPERCRIGRCKQASVQKRQCPRRIVRDGHIIQSSWTGRWKSMLGRESDVRLGSVDYRVVPPGYPKIEAVANRKQSEARRCGKEERT